MKLLIHWLQSLVAFALLLGVVATIPAGPPRSDADI
jgi:hypothetical protein